MANTKCFRQCGSSCWDWSSNNRKCSGWDVSWDGSKSRCGYNRSGWYRKVCFPLADTKPAATVAMANETTGTAKELNTSSEYMIE